MSKKIIYSPERMYKAVQDIRSHVQQSQQNYEIVWGKIQIFIEVFPEFMQSFLRDIFDPHDKRFRASHQWQLDFADRLSAAAAMVEATENSLQQGF